MKNQALIEKAKMSNSDVEKKKWKYTSKYSYNLELAAYKNLIQLIEGDDSVYYTRKDSRGRSLYVNIPSARDRNQYGLEIYKVVHRDEDGIPFVAYVKINGEESISWRSPLTDKNFKYEPHPLYLKSIILDEEFNPKDVYKKRSMK